LASLDRIRELVRSGRSTDALAALSAYDARFGGRGLVQESTLLRIQALAANGDPQAAARLARKFLAENPTSSHADAVRVLLEQSSAASP
jgi:outer membrane protein assembly factor BamD (BamD/ComL family)